MSNPTINPLSAPRLYGTSYRYPEQCVHINNAMKLTSMENNTILNIVLHEYI